MADQLDLLSLLATPAAPPAAAPAPPPRAVVVLPAQPCGCPPGRVCLGYIAHALRQVCPATISVLAGVTVLREVGDDRLALDPAGWTMAMLHRSSLVREQLTRTIAPGDAEVLGVLTRLQLAWAGLEPDGAVLVHPSALEHVHDMLAGLRCAAIEGQIG